MNITIKIDMEHPDEGNTIFINIGDARPSYITKYGPLGGRIHGYQFSAERDPSEWINEALESAMHAVKTSWHSFANKEDIGLTADQAVRAIIAYAKQLDYSAYGGFDSEVAKLLAETFHHRANDDWPE